MQLMLTLKRYDLVKFADIFNVIKNHDLSVKRKLTSIKLISLH